MGISELLETENAVVVEGRYSGLYKPTGKKLDLQVCHGWRFCDGKIKSFHQYANTAGLQDTMKSEPAKERVAS